MASATGEDKVTLEAFDDSAPKEYRKWQRRMQLMLASLPSTVAKEKLGPRLMQHMKGEAEQLCETIGVQDLCGGGRQGVQVFG